MSILGYQDWQLRGSAPGNPASGFVRMWIDNLTGRFKCLTSTGDASFFDGPMVIGFAVGGGAIGTAVGGRAIAPRAGSVSKCKVVINASDAAVDLTFTIKQNGVGVFTSNQTITHGASPGTLSTITSLTSTPLTVAADDLFTMEITSGSSSWAFTAQLES